MKFRDEPPLVNETDVGFTVSAFGAAGVADATTTLTTATWLAVSLTIT